MYITVYILTHVHTHVRTWHYALPFIHSKKQTFRSVIVKCLHINIK
jgi:hypothetical protein